METEFFLRLDKKVHFNLNDNDHTTICY